MAFVVEPVVSGLIKGLFKILGSNEVWDFARRLVGVESELKELENKLQMVENLLLYAEDKQLMDKSVKKWHDNLQQWAYDAEDLLDEFAYEALRCKMKAQHQASKGLSCLPACFPSPSFAVQMGSKIKEINCRLEKLRQQRSAEREFQELSRMTSSKAVVQGPEETSSVPPEQIVYGRNKDELTLLDMVKSGVDIQVIAVVGMGGIGKTTIARILYNHKQLEDLKFDKKAWVCVSTYFDVLKISKELIEQFSSSVPNNLNELQVKLKEAVSGKKFLIVLDDIWKVEYNEWEKLKSPFTAGATGSTMIVTTRHTDVAQTMRCSHTYHLNFLSQDDCKSLFQEHAFGIGAAAVPNQITDSIYKRVVESGLPLAAKTLGGLLRSKPSDTWEKILESNIWSTSDESDHILPALKLSFHYLPSNLKRCFGYCAIFPKDYEFEKKELALLWIAEGIIQPSDKQLDEASECFHKLCSRSLFQQLSSRSSKYIMHDLIHDLAQLVFKEIAFRSEQNIVELPEKFEKVRHFTYEPDDYTKENKFKALEKVKSLRTFLHVRHRHGYGYFISATVVLDLLPKLEMLRVLSFEGHCIIDLPNSIGDMMHLRYLNLSSTCIRSLPKSISQLFNLQTLLLQNCSYFMKLPSKIRYLTNLRHLDISGKNSLKEMPLGMKELKNLQILSNFIVGKDAGSNLEVLKSLSFLQGKLHISKLQNVTDPNQMREQILSNKNNLKVLLLEWGYQENSRKVDVETNVLEKLMPPSNLEELTIRGYSGESFPSWLGDLSWLSNLVVLKLEECKRCVCLPALEMLSSLEDLTIKDMASLKRIDFQRPFKSLEFLHFENLQEWEHWDSWRGNEDTRNFPKLRALFIKECPKLIGEVPDYLSSLESFILRNCPRLVISFSNYPIHCKLEIESCEELDGCEGIVCNDGLIDFKFLNSQCLANIPEVKDKLRKGFQRVEFLKIVGDEEIMESWRSLENTNFLSNLNSLEIRECQNLASIGRGMIPSSLKELEICDCRSLAIIGKDALPFSLKRFSIESCGELNFLKDLSVSLLKYLEICECESLKCISLDGPLPETLNELIVEGCEALEILSSSGNEYLPKALTSIYICNCEELKSIGESFDNSPCLQEITLEDCENLECLPLGLHRLPFLDSIVIIDCPKLLVREGVPTSLRQLLINECEDDKGMGIGMLTSLRTLQIGYLLQLESISDLSNLTSLVELNIAFLPLLESIPDLNNLKSLKVFTIVGLEFELIPNLSGLTSLTELCIEECQKLKSVPSLSGLTSLESLEINDLPQLRSIPDLSNLTSLTRFEISKCPMIKSIPNLSSLTSLTEFSITECAGLKSIPNLSSLTSHERLVIEDCPNLKSIPDLGNFKDLSIKECPKLRSLQTLPSSLQSLDVIDCPLLKKRWKSVTGKYSSRFLKFLKLK
ncbi:putative disease resistance RPP13-like protein 1 [Mangifera indica]|uniref:putative disease resistance RPP13-like protein 1 n=1 Tax=Mangifera indica TaxID=29780 RepID=UPI001CF948EB|nr:putative disease resistance RPP13-like protein 1 [Mangifera indica]